MMNNLRAVFLRLLGYLRDSPLFFPRRTFSSCSSSHTRKPNSPSSFGSLCCSNRDLKGLEVGTVVIVNRLVWLLDRCNSSIRATVVCNNRPATTWFFRSTRDLTQGSLLTPSFLFWLLLDLLCL
ncbi:hypothetical protein M9H77_22428 [Catharanthus roseus]|uniref:Uncharacterized protein n=1 Tax=Catharanthus roseus TaxID=4058 RepID=A0ACC0ARX9_CATRO|nr:hypothetical protein M9H77_22428 [Catharanthus roseus]